MRAEQTLSQGRAGAVERVASPRYVLGQRHGALASLVLKRCLDVVLSMLLLAAVLLVLVPACVAIRLDSPGSALYRQWRSGRGGRPFRILKLRTMVAGADRLGSALTQNADPRITRIGSTLRRWSLDELPQLLNVLAGQMSLVGPRPELVAIVESYTARQKGVLAVRPGLTGWAQVNGRDDLSISQKLELDLDYVANRTTLRDLHIMARTVGVVLAGRGTKW
ncbi:MAG TPA: sugar transferase [Streptosporangiaceae bacterium]|nr:sugar transferase [Streptosporangiaceae bacterium]